MMTLWGDSNNMQSIRALSFLLQKRAVSSLFTPSHSNSKSQPNPNLTPLSLSLFFFFSSSSSLIFMASSSFSSPLVLLGLLLSLSLFPFPSQSANCTSQTFSNSKNFDSCSDLPHLQSALHWTYHPSNSSLSLAFLAPPASPSGWVAWAINPTAKGMVGAQSLIAFRQPNSSIAVQTFNISAYGPIKPSPISFTVSGLHGEFSDGVMRIFATVRLPKNETKLNQVWQVGASVTNGLPDKHAFAQENLNALGELDLLGGKKVQQSNGTVSVNGGNGTTSTNGGGKQNGTVTGENSTTTVPSSSSLLVSPSVSLSSLFFGILTIFWSV